MNTDQNEKRLDALLDAMCERAEAAAPAIAAKDLRQEVINQAFVAEAIPMVRKLSEDSIQLIAALSSTATVFARAAQKAQVLPLVEGNEEATLTLRAIHGRLVEAVSSMPSELPTGATPAEERKNAVLARFAFDDLVFMATHYNKETKQIREGGGVITWASASDG